MAKWVKDVDTGELFPVQDDFDYEIPEHLKTAECNHIDYEKTTRTTIDELQSQLTAAQNEIEVIQQEKESAAVAEIAVKEVYPEMVSTKRFDFSLMKVIIAIVVASVFGVFIFFSFKFISDNDFSIDTNIAESTDISESEQESQQDTEHENQGFLQVALDYAQPVLVIFVCVSCVRLGVHFIKISY